MKTKHNHYTIENYSEETYCHWCGMPLIEGDKVYYDDEFGPSFCCPSCLDQHALEEAKA